MDNLIIEENMFQNIRNQNSLWINTADYMLDEDKKKMQQVFLHMLAHTGEGCKEFKWTMVNILDISMRSYFG